MDIVRVDFGPLDQGGDNGTAAIIKLDHDVQELADAITDGDNAAATLTDRVTAVEGKATDLDTRVTAAKNASTAAQATADAALSKAGGTVTGGLSVTGTVTANGQFIAGGGTMQVGLSNVSNWSINAAGVATRSAGSAPGDASSLVITVSGAYGGGYGIKDGANNIGFWSTGGDWVAGFGTNNGALTEQFRVRTTGILQVKGYQCRAGVSGAFGANSYNFLWGSGLTAYVDTANVGTVQLNSSDYRIKSDVRKMDDGSADLDLVMSVVPTEWEYAGIGPWEADGVRRRSWLAHELQEASGVLARGEKDAVDGDGNIIPQQVDALGVMSVLWGAVRQLKRENDALAARLAILEGGNHG